MTVDTSSMQNIKASQSALNAIVRSEKSGEKRASYQGRDDRATTEQVLDPRTRLILFKLLSNGFFTSIDGCLSTGKEANVYYGKRDYIPSRSGETIANLMTNNTTSSPSSDSTSTSTSTSMSSITSISTSTSAPGLVSSKITTSIDSKRTQHSQNENQSAKLKGEGEEDENERESKEFAVKVYKTSILVFKDRDRYVSGEHRFRNGYCRKNPRKMVKLWAEKEMRNLKRLQAAKIPSPNPVFIKNNVLVMEFLGSGGWPAPRLKDCNLQHKNWFSCYWQTIACMRRMYWDCKLVHGDLSEYNMLYHEEKVYIIDVSQSVEHEHPSAMDFLRSDCRNVNDFFEKKGIETASNRLLFDFIIVEDYTKVLGDYYSSLPSPSSQQETGSSKKPSPSSSTLLSTQIYNTLSSRVILKQQAIESKDTPLSRSTVSGTTVPRTETAVPGKTKSTSTSTSSLKIS